MRFDKSILQQFILFVLSAASDDKEGRRRLWAQRLRRLNIYFWK